MKFYSSQGEDRELFDEYFKNIKIDDGVFIELGAHNGIHASNTKFLEDSLGFNGILIEASPNLFTELNLNRPNTINYNFAISEVEGEVEFVGHKATSGMLHTMTGHHFDIWNLSKEEKYKVKTSKISNLTKENDVKYIDFFSIDVEGGELEVIKTIDWNVDIWLFLIEMTSVKSLDEVNHNTLKEGSLDRIKRDIETRNILESKGFTFIRRIGGNELWENKNYFRLNS